jgi:hypothetical protein
MDTELGIKLKQLEELLFQLDSITLTELLCIVLTSIACDFSCKIAISFFEVLHQNRLIVC